MHAAAAILSLLLVAPQQPLEGRLKVGDAAPNFKLPMLRSQDSFELQSNFGKRPTVLVFGSYT